MRKSNKKEAPKLDRYKGLPKTLPHKELNGILY